ncbi:MAG: efflux RND transporter periplasmic adaptor subunit [Succinivibrio sp.]|nr:efflux RND transporter periplasmic adaptor subunit [Succinivibrio sp.]
MRQRFYLAAILLAIFTLSACQKAQVRQTNTTYPTVTLAPTEATLQKEYSASLKGIQDVDVYPQVTGTIASIEVQDGALVNNGQVLLTIDPISYEAAYEKALANVNSAKAKLATSQLTYESRQKLLAQKAISYYDTQSALNTYNADQAALKQAEAELKGAENDLTHTNICSPLTGVSGIIKVRVGDLVSPSMSEPLVSLSDNSQILAYFSLSEREGLALSKWSGRYQNLSKLAPKVKLRLSDNTIFEEEGVIDAVSGVIDSSTGAVTIRAVFPNPEGILKSGGSATLIIPIELKDQLVIPQTATYEIQDRKFVYKVVDGKATSTQINVMPVDDGRTYVVIDGLKEGDVIISEGAGLVREGVQVNVASQNKSPAADQKADNAASEPDGTAKSDNS